MCGGGNPVGPCQLLRGAQPCVAAPQPRRVHMRQHVDDHPVAESETAS